MKESRYNFYLSDDEEKTRLIYNAFKNTLVEDEEGKIHNYIEQYKSDVKFNSEFVKEEEYNDLISLGIIVPDEMDERQCAIDANTKKLQSMHQSNKVLSLTIIPTLLCNFKCRYCFESMNTRKNNEHISDEVQNDIIEFIVKSITDNHIKVINIVWYGGEPLLQRNIILSMQSKINEICTHYQIKNHSKIITNGFLLSHETSDLLNKYGIRKIQVTIDGPEHIHNKRRYYPQDPNNNFKTICDNIYRANENIKFLVRINIDKLNMEYIIELIDDLISRKIWPHKNNVSLLTAPVESSENTDLSGVEFSKFESRIRYYMREKYAEINYQLADKVKLNFLYPCPGGDARCGFGVSKNAWVINYDGDLFRCWEPVGQKEHSLGTIQNLLDDFGASIFERIKVDSHLVKQWGCYECKFFPICGNKCHWDFINNNEERRCTEWKNTLKHRLMDQYKLYQQKPNIFANVPFKV
ncbi:MAG: radical SAM protein [Prevotellaceae bacterium]|jgi:uncharacterized protein|nr:radical SAM protein [Prevotellaceae bacterium]